MSKNQKEDLDMSKLINRLNFESAEKKFYKLCTFSPNVIDEENLLNIDQYTVYKIPLSRNFSIGHSSVWKYNKIKKYIEIEGGIPLISEDFLWGRNLKSTPRFILDKNSLIFNIPYPPGLSEEENTKYKNGDLYSGYHELNKTSTGKDTLIDKLNFTPVIAAKNQTEIKCPICDQNRDLCFCFRIPVIPANIAPFIKYKFDFENNNFELNLDVFINRIFACSRRIADNRVKIFPWSSNKSYGLYIMQIPFNIFRSDTVVENHCFICGELIEKEIRNDNLTFCKKCNHNQFNLHNIFEPIKEKVNNSSLTRLLLQGEIFHFLSLIDVFLPGLSELFRVLMYKLYKSNRSQIGLREMITLASKEANRKQKNSREYLFLLRMTSMYNILLDYGNFSPQLILILIDHLKFFSNQINMPSDDDYDLSIMEERYKLLSSPKREDKIKAIELPPAFKKINTTIQEIKKYMHDPR